MTPLGLIAGGGDLPRAIAESVAESGRSLYVLAVAGLAGDWTMHFPHDVVSLGEIGKAKKLFAQVGCREIVMAGRIERPKFSEVKFDAGGMLAAPRLAAAMLKGDDALLRAVVEVFERDGLAVIGAAEAAPGLIAPKGALGRISPTTEQETDIALGFQVVRALGALDVGQAAVVCAGLTLAVEAAEGTDAMLARIAQLPEHLRGTETRRRGVLVKALKPVQDRKTDLPVAGFETVRNAAAVHLAGIAVEAGAALIVDRRAVAEEADRLGLFLVGAG